ncbi:LysR substrate-binding domain-containing protein [Salipiger sp. 1_MG-2023]|uniref:LysR substrate-binding domain-containing protein n=1 Tax=Salipiger sp. 1_MG-2023 TaxID=3062665 RepID=UPI0026E34C6E|nr:LysR substrate-binding domain-containing protein [Salipiger sp. 1_MG-2023]MDO6586546.1 LysR substrate-binding domain-containing protein [Salipiger sp. 1_MG-2023]
MLRFNLRQIEAFRAVIETGNMTHAGEVLGVTQPAISRLIRDLEEEYGLQLFVRQAGRIEPTKDAIALHVEVERCYGELEQLVKFATNLGEFRRKRLRVASTVGHSYFLLPEVIRRFHDLCPDVIINLFSGTSPEVVEQIEKGRSDIGLALLPLDVHGVDIRELPETNLVCVMPQAHPLGKLATVTPGDLAQVPLLLISESSLMRKRLLQAFKDADVTPNVILNSTYTGPICSLVANGMGVSIMDKLTADAYSGLAIDIRPFSPSIPCELKLVLPASQVLSQPGKVFLDLLLEHTQ